MRDGGQSFTRMVSVEGFVVVCFLTCFIHRVGSALADLGDPPEIYLAISTEDSSIVYYKISRGFVKPPL